MNRDNAPVGDRDRGEPVFQVIPRCLDWLRESKDGRLWLDALPAVVAECADRWDLELNEPYEDSYVSLVVPAERREDKVVLKVQFPHRESEHEAAALMAWEGRGAIRLIEHDPDRSALLLERCDPGTHLSAAGGEVGLNVIIGLLPRLWIPAGEPFGSLRDETERWIRDLPEEWGRAGQPYEQTMLDHAIDVLSDLAATQGQQVLLHQDLHGDNVLAAERHPWLAIDPKPLLGEREFGLSPVIRSHEFGHSREAVVGRLDRLTSALGLDRERARLWAFGQAIAWGLEDGKALPRHIEIARWLRDA